MRILVDRKHGLLVLGMMFAVRLAFGCDQLPEGQPVWIRLTAPISTYTAQVGDPVHAILTEDLVCNNEIVLPMGADIEGVVRNKRKVGWGIRHETAALELEFNHASNGSGESVDLRARVDEVENARETVRKGVIEGIRSSDTFQGRINSRLIHLPTWNPYSDPVLITYKAVFSIFPEPEIYYPAGTEMRLRTADRISVPVTAAGVAHESSPADKAEADRLDRLVEQLPSRVTTEKKVNADVINVVFLGSEKTVTSAFEVAGWRTADPASKRTVLKNLYAVLNHSGYAQQPMMTFYLNGKPEDMNWQKSLNSYDRRDHLRIWQWTSTESSDTVWISSSTHDTEAVLAVKHMGFVHHISPAIDEERSTIIRDLAYAGCVKSVNYVPRPEIPATTYNATGDVIHTDGSVAVVTLQECKATAPQFELSVDSDSYRPGNHAFRFFRRQILTFRNDIFRANIIYGVYDVGRMTVTSLHKPAIR